LKELGEKGGKSVHERQNLNLCAERALSGEGVSQTNSGKVSRGKGVLLRRAPNYIVHKKEGLAPRKKKEKARRNPVTFLRTSQGGGGGG